jgi:hypothetical protein
MMDRTLALRVSTHFSPSHPLLAPLSAAVNWLASGRQFSNVPALHSTHAEHSTHSVACHTACAVCVCHMPHMHDIGVCMVGQVCLLGNPGMPWVPLCGFAPIHCSK